MTLIKASIIVLQFDRNQIYLNVMFHVLWTRMCHLFKLMRGVVLLCARMFAHIWPLGDWPVSRQLTLRFIENLRIVSRRDAELEADVLPVLRQRQQKLDRAARELQRLADKIESWCVLLPLLRRPAATNKVQLWFI